MRKQIFPVFAAIAMAALIPVVHRADAQASPPKIISIGDSVTDDFGQGSWRLPLGQKLTAVGQPYTYVGSRSDIGGRHESYGGASTCDFVTPRTRDYIETAFGKAPTWDIRQAIIDAGAQIAIVDLGTNDWIDWQYVTSGLASSAPCVLHPSSLGRTFDAILNSPGITGMVVTTIESASGADWTENANVMIRAWVAAKRAQNRNVCLGELPASFVGLTSAGDSYHLNAAGREALATALLAPVRTAIGGNCAAVALPATTTSTTSTTVAPTTTSAPTTIPGASSPLFSPTPGSSFTAAQAAANPPGFRSGSVGLRFTANTTLNVTALRFAKAAGDPATSRQVAIFDANGNIVASATSSESVTSSAVAMVTVPLSVTLPPGNYTAAIYLTSGAYTYAYNVHATPIVTAKATAPVNAGVYVYGTSLALPTSAYLASDYAIDIVA